jgi:dihydroorotase
MLRIKALGKPLTAHCEVDSLLVPGGCVHDGDWAREHGFAGISSASEWRMVERDLELVRETRCPYHVCHVSTKESVALIRAAKAEGLPVTCETAPHYLLLCDADLADEGRFKMNPPVRSRADRDALLAALCDGTVDCIATDHAPHSAAEKAKGLRGSAFGIVGLETAFALLYTKLVVPGVVPLAMLVDRMAVRPRRIFGGIPGAFADGSPADFAAFDISGLWTVDPDAFRSKGRATPFAGWRVAARTALMVIGGRPVLV